MVRARRPSSSAELIRAVFAARLAPGDAVRGMRYIVTMSRLSMFALLVLFGSPVVAEQKAKPAKICRAHDECPSGVCSRFKKDNGHCAPVRCRVGERTDNNHFFCSAKMKWQPSRREGEACKHSYECFEPTCFMNPMCDLRPGSKAACTKGECTLTRMPSPCELDGRKVVLAPEEYAQDGTCMQSLAQRILRTVCVPCGNGVCDADESPCNCPSDCPSSP